MQNPLAGITNEEACPQNAIVPAIATVEAIQLRNHFWSVVRARDVSQHFKVFTEKFGFIANQPGKRDRMPEQGLRKHSAFELVRRTPISLGE